MAATATCSRGLRKLPASRLRCSLQLRQSNFAAMRTVPTKTSELVTDASVTSSEVFVGTVRIAAKLLWRNCREHRNREAGSLRKPREHVAVAAIVAAAADDHDRSEERRVGKECRSRW